MKQVKYIKILAFVMAVFTPVIVKADCLPLPPPTGEVVLSITGNIACTNTPGRADFDINMLDQMPQKTLRTTTPWSEGVQVFTGVSLQHLLNTVQASAATLTGMAHNDYHVDIPVTDVTESEILLATRHNGEFMTLRTRGPIRIIYPDTSPSTEALSRMIWQLRTLDARD